MNQLSAADNYLQNIKGFNLETIKGMYSQCSHKLKNGTISTTVRFPLWDNSYYERLIDDDKIAENDGIKAYISPGTILAGRAWIPKDMTFEENDTIYITEGIFDSIELLQFGQKSIAALSCVNFPADIIEEHQGKHIIWVLAYFKDQTAITYRAKHLERIKKLSKKCGIKKEVIV